MDILMCDKSICKARKSCDRYINNPECGVSMLPTWPEHGLWTMFKWKTARCQYGWELLLMHRTNQELIDVAMRDYNTLYLALGVWYGAVIADNDCDRCDAFCEPLLCNTLPHCGLGPIIAFKAAYNA